MYPSTLATRSDYEYVRQNFPKSRYYQDFLNLLETEYNWFFERIVDDDETVEQNFTQRVLTDPQTGVKSLYLWKQDPNCKLLELGYTRQEVTAILNGDE